MAVFPMFIELEEEICLIIRRRPCGLAEGGNAFGYGSIYSYN